MLASNLEHTDYVEILCGSMDNLPAAFADLDAEDRSRALPARTQKSRLDPQRKPSPQASEADEVSSGDAGDLPADVACTIASASMPRADRTIFRAKALDELFLAASRSRVPRFPGHQPTVV